MPNPHAIPANISEKERGLVERAKLGDRVALEELLVGAKNLVCGKLCSLGWDLSSEDIQDIFQQSAKHILSFSKEEEKKPVRSRENRLQKFAGNSQFSTWLTIIALNFARSEWRKEKGKFRACEPLEDLSPESSEIIPKKIEIRDLHLEASVERMVFWQTLSRLPRAPAIAQPHAHRRRGE